MERSEPDGHLVKRRATNVQRPTLNAQHPTTEEILAILHKWGIHTLGQFASLDKEDLNARLGPEAVRLWERANGKSTRLLKLVQPPESFVESFEFEHEVETVEPLLFMLRRFLQQLALRLSAIYLVAKELTFRITFADKKQYERCFKIPQPTNDVDLLFRMLHTHLENFTSEQPIIAVSLEAQPIKPARQQFGLFQTALRDPNQLYETLARLTALLGTDRVGTPVLEETYRPDAFRMEPFVWNLSANANGTDGPHPAISQTHSFALTGASRPSLPRGERTHSFVLTGASRPILPRGERGTCGSTAVREGAALRRFRPPESASVLLNENMPAHIRSAHVEGEIFSHKGPYVTSGNWWDEKSWTRAEWDLQLDNGIVARCHQSGETWEIDGVYD
jgi:protein ImuB